MTIDNTNVAAPTPGSILKGAREEKGLSQADVAHRLNLRISLVREIELDRFDQQTASTFTRGYLKTYARFVGVDEDLVLNAYDRLGVTGKSMTEMHSFSGRTHREANEYKIRFISWGIVILLLVAGGTYWWLQPVEEPVPTKISEAGVLVASEDEKTDVKPSEPNVQTNTESSQPLNQVASQEKTTDGHEENGVADIKNENSAAVAPDDEQSHTVLTSEAANSGSPADSQNVVSPAADKSSEVTAVSSAESTTSAETKTASTTPPATGILQLKFSSSCWLKIVDAKGKSLFEGTKAAGDYLDLTGSEPISLTIGAPESVEVTFHGQSVDMGQYVRRGVVARYQLPLKN